MAVLTAKDYVEIILKKHNISFSEAEIKVEFIGIESDPLVSAEEIEGLAIAQKVLVSMLSGLLLSPNVTEGGYSIAWNYESVKSYLNFLNNKLGLPLFGEATLTDQTSKW